MEFVFELLFEIIIEGTLDIGTTKKVPLFFRIIAMIGFLAVYVGIVGLLLIYGVDALRSQDLFGGVLCIFTALVVLAGCIYMVAKKLREREHKEA